MSSTPTSPALYLILSRLLLAGVMVSLALMCVGYALLEIRHDAGRAWLPLGQIVPRALAGDARGLLDLGVLVLLATPTLRVAAAIILVARERRGRDALIEAAVLCLLALSLALALLRQ